MTVPNILACRYASATLRAIWSEETKVQTERKTWVAVLKAQKEAGLPLDEQVIADYEACVDQVDLKAIREVEKITHHDVKARVEVFNALAKHQAIHLGMTSRDLTENVEQTLIIQSLRYLQLKSIAVLKALGKKAATYATTPLATRTHEVPAQLSTLGKRFACWGEELQYGLEKLEHLLQHYKLRGLKGAVGTQADSLRLLGKSQKVDKVEKALLNLLNFEKTWNALGQIYPRSLDFEVLSQLYQLTSPLASFAYTLRLMAGHQLADEGFETGQAGSSAMPHKVNCRAAERLCGLHSILSGHVQMSMALAGKQWNEGDVSCSVTRRVLFPDALLATDAILETSLHILLKLRVHDKVLRKEVDRYLPFLMTGALLGEAIKAGAGRENAHALIKKHALEAAKCLQEGQKAKLLENLGADTHYPLNQNELATLLEESREDTGNAEKQVARFLQNIKEIADRFPQANEVKTSPLL